MGVSAHYPPQEGRDPDLPALHLRRPGGPPEYSSPPPPYGMEVRLPTTTTTTLPPSRASPGVGSAGTSLWRRPRLCSRATQFSAQFPTLIPPRKIKLGNQAEAGRAGGPVATHAGALGGAHGPLGARLLLLPPVWAPAFRATSPVTPGPAAPRTSATPRCYPTRGPRPPGQGSGGAVTPARSRKRSACAATVPGKQIQAGCFPLHFSRPASSPGFPRGAGGW